MIVQYFEIRHRSSAKLSSSLLLFAKYRNNLDTLCRQRAGRSTAQMGELSKTTTLLTHERASAKPPAGFWKRLVGG